MTITYYEVELLDLMVCGEDMPMNAMLGNQAELKAIV